jgi:hypothetical protein
MSNEYNKSNSLEDFSSEGHNSEDSERNLFHEKIYKVQQGLSSNHSPLQSTTNPTTAMINLSQNYPISNFNSKQVKINYNS